MEKVNAIVVKATDYKEADKLVRLCSVEKGTLTATLKGCKKATAKLAFAGRPFLFGEFILTERSGRYTITGCSPVESYANIVSVTDFYAGAVVLELLDTFVTNGTEWSAQIVHALKALSALGDTHNDSVLIAYILKAFEIEGYPLDFKTCVLCGNKPKNFYFSFSDGGTVCENCTTENALAIDLQTVNFLRMLSDVEIERARNVNVPTKNASLMLSFLASYFENVWGAKLRCVREYLKLPILVKKD